LVAVIHLLHFFMSLRVFGHISYYQPGDTFENRLALSRAGMHRPTRAGISGTPAEGADSIVLADQYEDDVFAEDELVYAGHGGRDPKTGHQVSDQDLNSKNQALLQSHTTGQPVRVIRKVAYEDERVYRYEGLYQVVGATFEAGKSGFMVWKFRLVPFPAAA
jgi:predicted restriction endonuclease